MNEANRAEAHSAHSKPVVRAAELGDLPEILRLVGELGKVMDSIYGGPALTIDDDWRARVEESLIRRLGNDVAIFVVDAEAGRLGSLAAGYVHEPIPRPRGKQLLEGELMWVVTDVDQRGKGYAAAVTSELLAWFGSRDALVVRLEATPEAESLYRRLGFSDEGPRALSIRLESAQPDEL